MGTGPARQGRGNSSRVHHIRNRDGEPVRGRLGKGKKKKGRDGESRDRSCAGSLSVVLS